MEYTVNKLSKLAGISTRTLRYYDEIGILKPARINSSGYRIYGQSEINMLQQILFYKELGLPLDSIKYIITSPAFDGNQALIQHHHELLEKRKQLDSLILTIEKTITSSKGEIKMTDKEKFEGFKEKLVEANEDKYGKEIREKYGVETVDKSNKMFQNMNKEDFDKFTSLGNEINLTLLEAFKTGDPSSDIAQKVAQLHKDWLNYTWPNYSKEAHVGLAQIYVDDERFTAYYDKEQPGLAVFLRDAIVLFTGKDK
jgi:DNA-binding transcriptional MerR regulator